MNIFNLKNKKFIIKFLFIATIFYHCLPHVFAAGDDVESKDTLSIPLRSSDSVGAISISNNYEEPRDTLSLPLQSSDSVGTISISNNTDLNKLEQTDARYLRSFQGSAVVRLNEGLNIQLLRRNLASLTSIKIFTVQINEGDNVNTQLLTAIVDSIQSFSHLEYLNVYNCHFNEETCKNIINSITSRSIKQLDFRENNLSADTSSDILSRFNVKIVCSELFREPRKSKCINCIIL